MIEVVVKFKWWVILVFSKINYKFNLMINSKQNQTLAHFLQQSYSAVSIILKLLNQSTLSTPKLFNLLLKSIFYFY